MAIARDWLESLESASAAEPSLPVAVALEEPVAVAVLALPEVASPIALLELLACAAASEPVRAVEVAWLSASPSDAAVLPLAANAEAVLESLTELVAFEPPVATAVASFPPVTSASQSLLPSLDVFLTVPDLDTHRAVDSAAAAIAAGAFAMRPNIRTEATRPTRRHLTCILFGKVIASSVDPAS